MRLHFLYLTNSRLVSMSTSGKRIVMRREFAVSGTGAAQFERYLAEIAAVPVHLFVDLAEEDFRLDTIPHVGARDREAIFARKLTQIFRNTPFRYAEAQGREPEGRRDDRVLYTAITNPEVLRPWLDCIERLQVPLAGIHSAALFSAVMLEELDLLFPHTLLVTFTPGEAMRQSFFRDRELKFSRLTPVDIDASQGLGAMISDETTRTWQYLDSLRHFAPDDRLEVCVVLHPDERAKVQPALHDFAQIQHRILDIEQVAAKLGLKPPPLGSTVEEVFVHLFLLRHAPNHFASSELRRYYTLRKARLALYRGSAAVLAASLAWGGWNLAQVMQGGESDQRNAQEMAASNREYDEITRDLPSFGVGGSTMRDAVGFYNFSIRGFPTVNAFMVALSQVLEEHPEVRLTQIAWQASDDDKATPTLPATPVRESPPVKAVATAQSGAAPIPQRGEAAFPSGRYEVALVEGTVNVPNNDFRGALERVQRLAADIGKLDGFSAEVRESPLDLRPTVALEGRHAEREPATMAPRFVLRVVHARRAVE
jgi:hypothetical protein